MSSIADGGGGSAHNAGRHLIPAQRAFTQTKLEAAREIAVQLKLRNLSGIILIDFIDMAEEPHKESVLQALKQELYKDPVKTTVLGYTRLNLVEMTRKKVRKKPQPSI